MATNQFEGGSDSIKLDSHAVEYLGGRISGEMELRIDKVQAVMDAKLNGVEREINAKLDGKPGHGGLIAHTVAIVALLGGLMAFGGDRFDGGMSASGAFATQIEAQASRDSDQDKKLDKILDRLEDLNDKSEDRPKN